MNKTENNIEYFGYNIEHKSYTDVTREADPDDQWDSDSLQTTWDIENKLIETNNNHPDIVVPFKLENNKDYFLVYLIYSSGDSFHNHDGYAVEFIEVFENKQKANDLSQLIKDNNSSYKKNQNLGENSFILNYLDEKGNSKQICTSWNGYFENLDTVEVLTVQNNSLKNKLKKMR